MVGCVAVGFYDFTDVAETLEQVVRSERGGSSPRGEGLLIRDARADDAIAIAAIYAPIVSESTISFELEAPTAAEIADRIIDVQERNPWLVLEVDGEVVGYAYATMFRGRPAYAGTRETTVYVHPDHRRRGIAGTLMRALLTALAESGVRVVVAGITLPNDASVALHEALGFRHVGTFHEVGRKFGLWLDVGFWELRLES